MAMELKCEDLNVKNCSFVVQGETARDIIKETTKHLRKDHGINLPDVQEVLEGRDLDKLEDGTRLLVERLRWVLGIRSKAETPDTRPGTRPPSIVPGPP
jgi:predicted small metal-binding protein